MKDKSNSDIFVLLAKFFIPIIIGLIVLITVGLFIGELSIRYWPLITAYFFPPLGKESVIPLGIAAGINPLVIALSIAFIDIIVALFLVFNYDLAKKIPVVGGFIAKVEKIGRGSSEKYGWIRPLRFLGVVLFVMVPFQGSGGLVASIVGRLIGMKPWTTFMAISIGAVTGCLLIAYFADAILDVFIQNFLFGLLIIIILVVIGIMVLMYKRSKNSRK